MACAINPWQSKHSELKRGYEIPVTNSLSRFLSPAPIETVSVKPKAKYFFDRCCRCLDPHSAATSGFLGTSLIQSGEACRFGDKILVVTAGFRGKVKLWRGNISDMKFEPAATLIGTHGANVTDVDIAQNATYAISSSRDYTLAVWDLMYMKKVHSFRHDSRVTACAFYKASHTLSAAEKKGHCQEQNDGEDENESIFSHFDSGDRELLFASGTEDGCIRHWTMDTKTGEILNEDTLPGFSDPIKTLIIRRRPEEAKLNHQRYVAVGTTGGELRVIDIDGWKSYILGGSKGSVNALCTANEGRLLVVGNAEGSILIYDLVVLFNSFKRRIYPMAEIENAHKKGITSLSFARNRLMSGSDDNIARVWRFDTLELETWMKGMISPVNYVLVSDQVGDRRYLTISSSEVGISWHTNKMYVAPQVSLKYVHMSSLPADLYREIASWLDQRSIAMMGSLSRTLHKAIQPSLFTIAKSLGIIARLAREATERRIFKNSKKILLKGRGRRARRRAARRP